MRLRPSQPQLRTLSQLSAVGHARHVHLLGVTGAMRMAKFQEREHMVVPVVALMEGVVFPVNAETPEYVPAAAFSVAPQSWNGRPVFASHPTFEGVQVSGNSPHILEKAFGTVFNTAVTEQKLLMEAWLDTLKAKNVDGGPEILERLHAGEVVEVSVGVYVTGENLTGEYEGKQYGAMWHLAVPDHLAILREGEVGACSIAMGCGTPRMAQLHVLTNKGLKVATNEEVRQVIEHSTAAQLETLRAIPKAVRDKLPTSDFAGPNRTFPIQKPEDVAAASRAIGRARGGAKARAAIKSRIISIAYRKGPKFVSKLPDAWKETKDRQNMADTKPSVLERMMTFVKSLATGMSDVEVRNELRDALTAREPAMSWIEAVYPDAVVYCVYANGESKYYQRGYSLDEKGNATVEDSRVEVELVMTYEPLSAADPAGEPTASSATTTENQHPCGCGGSAPTAATSSTSGEGPMKTKAERIQALIDNPQTPYTAADKAMLEVASEERLGALEAHVTAASSTPSTGAPHQTPSSTPSQPPASTPTTPSTPTSTPSTPTSTPSTPSTPTPGTTGTGSPHSTAPTTAAAKPQTEEEYLQNAPESIRMLVTEAKERQAAEKAALVITLKGAQTEYTEAELQAMDNKQLQRLSRLTKAPAPVVNYAGAGVPAPTPSADGVPPAPDLNARILEMNRHDRAQKTPAA